MNLFRSMCCLFGGRCAEDQPKPPTNAMREVPGDLGQREAEREKASKDQLGHMEGGATTNQGIKGA